MDFGEYMDMNDEDAINLEDDMNEGETEMQETEPAPAQSETQAAPDPAHQTRRKRRLTSAAWQGFVPVGVESDGKERGECIYCHAKLVINTKTHGTTHLLRHLEKCPKAPKKIDRPPYDHKVDREMTSEIIIYHDLPFRYVEYEKVRARNLYLNPDCKHICRQTAASDVFKRYLVEKEKLKEVFANHHGRVCFTSDLWLSRATVTGYICLTASFVDASWRLNSKILAFCDLDCAHTGEELARVILECLTNWGLEKKVFSITLDNASSNDSMQRNLNGQLQMISGSGLVCDGKFFHVRCCAHILNLIVKEGLLLANDLLNDIRESVRYVKASPQRRKAFTACAEREGIKSGAGLSLDIKTRWNSTYDMLVRALRYRKAFESMETFDPHYKTLPSEDEWKRGENICELLKPFSIITTYMSGSKYPTSNVYFTQVWRIEMLLQKYARSDDYAIREMVRRMQGKFNKYWEDYSIILAMGAVLDPRLKVQMLEKAYEAVDPTTSTLKIEELKANLKMLYNDYQTRNRASSSGVSATPTPHEILTESPLEHDIDDDLFELERSLEDGVGNTKTHLDIYLDEPRLARSAFPDLDVLTYWKDNQHRLSGLSDMARDLLTIPITTVASESTFSIGARVLTPYRNRLLPKNVQALICTRNWLRGYEEYEGTIEDTNEASSSGIEGSTSGNSIP